MRNFWALLFVVCAAVSSWAGVIAPSTSTLAATSGNPEEVTLTWNSAGDDGGAGDLTGNYYLQYATYTVAWSTSSTPTDATTVTIATTAQVPGSAQSHTVTGLTSGLTYYFVLWTEDEVPNWSGISNTTAAVGGYWFDPTQIEVDGLSGGLRDGGVVWGDFDNDGDLDILASGYTGATSELRIYKNNGNGTLDPMQIEVGGANGGLSVSSVVWGDYDNDGDLDILVSGYTGASTSELRVYTNNGTMDMVQIEVDSSGNASFGGGVAWGDFDNDGDLDILASGRDNPDLRIYKNNGNGTIDVEQLEVDGASGGLVEGRVGWGDFDNDGDLDILASGFGYTNELRVYKNNGNGTLNATQIEVDGAGGGLYGGSVGWGDFDNDGDLDILASGYTGATSELRIYKNNGNGTFNATQIEVDGEGGGLAFGGVGWGDFDNDGDLDILGNGDTGSSYEFRVYKNNGNGTVSDNQIEVLGSVGGLLSAVLGGAILTATVIWTSFPADPQEAPVS